MPACQTALCGPDQDCVRVSHDELCPPHRLGITCLAPQCTSSGCGFSDICEVSHPGCSGCADCSCTIALNKCVRSCPS
jgi:hypothetical protein